MAVVAYIYGALFLLAIGFLAGCWLQQRVDDARLWPDFPENAEGEASEGAHGRTVVRLDNPVIWKRRSKIQ